MIVITLMLGGTGLCMTSIILTWRVVARTLKRARRARLNTPDEDLTTADGLEPIVLEAHAAASDRLWLP